MDLGEVCEVGAGGFEDAEAKEAEHGDQGEVVAVGRVAGGGQKRFELQVTQPESG